MNLLPFYAIKWHRTLNPLHKNLPFLAKNKGVSVPVYPYFYSSATYISEPVYLTTEKLIYYPVVIISK